MNPPASFWLTEPSPSPFVNSTSLTVALPERETLLVNIQTATGVIVRHLYGEMTFAGYHGFTWDGKNDAGARCEVGFYYITAQAGPYRSSQIVKLQR
jgi:flagellar hook assembly protein FlgD